MQLQQAGGDHYDLIALQPCYSPHTYKSSSPIPTESI